MILYKCFSVNCGLLFLIIFFIFRAVILFVIEDITYNICDQRFHEYEIRRQRPDVHVIRRNLTQISKNGHLTDDKRLIM